MSYSIRSQSHFLPRLRRHSPLLAAMLLLPTLASGERIGLHVTTEELAIWRERAQQGPYRVAGDVATNSPGDWARIVRRADEFLANPGRERWSGQTSGCWSPEGTPARPGRTRGEWIVDAAFVSLVNDDARYRDAVLDVLLAQAADPGTDFSGPRWCNTAIGDAHSHEIVGYLTKLLYAYDYIRLEIPAADRATLDAWFDDAADFWSAVVNKTVERAFPNRELDDYSTSPHTAQCTFGTCITHFNGWKFYNFHETWNNRNATQILFAGSAAIMTGNTVVQARAKRYFKEWLRFAVFPDSTDSDFRRWTEEIPSLGWAYSSHMTGTMAILADHFARAGDLELYEYSTSEGFRDLTPAGGPKSLKSVMKLLYQHVDGSVERYGTKDPAKAGDPNYRISAADRLSGQSWVNDTCPAPANVYFRDDYFKSIYMRTAPNAPPYPANPTTGGWAPWTGCWGTLPGVMFMFGDMEGRVWPYGKPQEPLRPKAPVLQSVK